MSTCAFDGKSIASDTAQVNGNRFDLAEAQKVYQAGDEYVAIAGHFGAALLFVKWWQDGHPMDKRPSFPDESFEALVVGPNSEPLHFDRALQGIKVGIPCAIGSGECEALGAMLAGATAEEAVKIACRLDPHTREPVRVVTLE